MCVLGWIALINWMWHKNTFTFSGDAEEAHTTITAWYTLFLHKGASGFSWPTSSTILGLVQVFIVPGLDTKEFKVQNDRMG